MNRLFLFISIFLILLFAAGASFASVASSEDFSLSIAVVDAGGGTSESSDFALLGKLRDRSVNSLVSSGYDFRLGEGFLRTIYYSPMLNPYIVGINPGLGYNDDSVFVTITGFNFSLAGVSSASDETSIVKLISSLKCSCKAFSSLCLAPLVAIPSC